MMIGYLVASLLELSSLDTNVCAKTTLDAPKGVLANAVADEIVLSWERVEGADEYEIYEKCTKIEPDQKSGETKKDSKKRKKDSKKEKKNSKKEKVASEDKNKDSITEKAASEDKSKDSKTEKAGFEDKSKDSITEKAASEDKSKDSKTEKAGSEDKKKDSAKKKKAGAGKDKKKSKYEKVCSTKARAIVLPDREREVRYTYKVRAVKKGRSKDKAGKFSKAAGTRLAPEGSRTTLKGFLTTAMAPVGSTMYIWDGGWKSRWKGRGADGAWIGLNPKWRAYADSRDSDFNYRKVRYKHGLGLDCSGYVGWVTYNVMKTKSAKSGRGYVSKSTVMASQFAKRGWGVYRKAAEVKNYRAGDVMSTRGHVYIVIGQCEDGSVVLLHSSPPGVQICGTRTRSGKKKSQAVKLAKKYRKKYFSDWHERFKKCDRPADYLKEFNQFRWDLTEGNVMSDPDGYRKMGPEEILKDILKK